MIENTLVVVRSSGERTLNACVGALENQVPAENIQIIEEKPFNAAVKKNFELGLEASLKWTLALDADIVLKSEAIKEMVSEADHLPDHFFLYQGYVLDKLFGHFRMGGPHLYRTAHLTKAIDFIPSPFESLRPESHTYGKMVELGFHYLNDNRIFGLHDYEQSYFDLFRKGYLHAKKHPNELAKFMAFWSAKMSEDKDLEVAFDGLYLGLKDQEVTEVNTDFFLEKFRSYSDANSLPEKPESVNLNARVADDMIRDAAKSDYWIGKLKNPDWLIKRSDGLNADGKRSFSWRLAKFFEKVSNRFYKLSGSE